MSDLPTLAEMDEIIANLDRMESGPDIGEDSPDFIPGVKRGVDQTQASAFGFVALAGSGMKKVGMDDAGQAVQDWGVEGYKRNIAEAGENPAKNRFTELFTDPGFGKSVDYVQGMMGELIPSMAEAALGGIIGTMAAPGPGSAVGAFSTRTILKKSIKEMTDALVKDRIKKGIIKEGMEVPAKKLIRKEVTKTALKKMGGKAGMVGAVMPIESGGMYADELVNENVDAPASALFFGSLAASIELVGGNSQAVDVMVDALTNGNRATLKSVAKDIAKNIPQEGFQESTQEVMAILNHVINTEDHLLTAENLEQVIDAFGAGAVGGGAGGVGTGAMALATSKPIGIDEKQNLLDPDKGFSGENMNAEAQTGDFQSAMEMAPAEQTLNPDQIPFTEPESAQPTDQNEDFQDAIGGITPEMKEWDQWESEILEQRKKFQDAQATATDETRRADKVATAQTDLEAANAKANTGAFDMVMQANRERNQNAIDGAYSQPAPANEGEAEVQVNIETFRKERKKERSVAALEERQANMQGLQPIPSDAQVKAESAMDRFESRAGQERTGETDYIDTGVKKKALSIIESSEPTIILTDRQKEKHKAYDPFERITERLGGKVKRPPSVQQQSYVEEVETAAQREKGLSDTALNQPPSDSRVTDAKLFGTSSMANTIRSKGFKSLDRNSHLMVLANVNSALNDDKIFEAVIKAVPVNVMDNLIGKEWATNSLLHNKSMLRNRIAVSGEKSILEPVVTFVDSLSSIFKVGFAGRFAEKTGLPLPGGPRPGKDASTMRTGKSLPGAKSFAALGGTKKLDLVGTAGGDNSLETDSTGRTHKGSHIATSLINGQVVKTDINPTDKQKQAGNYLHGTVKVHGLDIAIENPGGSVRKGVDGQGNSWETTMQDHYGYFKRSEGRDGDQVDVFIKPGTLMSPKTFIVDQVDPKTGKFDEHKAIMGASSESEAREIYARNYDKGWQGLGAITEMNPDDFKVWLKDGKRTKKPLAMSPQGSAAKKTEDSPKGPQSKTDTAYLPDNTPVKFVYEIVELDDLLPSHDTDMKINPEYPQELQPRDRERAGSRAQIHAMAKDLNPARLMESKSVANGAPIIGNDNNVVESGNGRVIALDIAYGPDGDKAKGQFYKNTLGKNLESLGFNSGSLNEMEKPVLVRRRTTKIDDLVSFVQKANETEVAKMSPAEQAKVDAKNLTKEDMAHFHPSKDGSLAAASNQNFVSRFLKKMSAEEASGYMTADGMPTRQLIDRMQAAVFQKAYESDELLSMMAEDADPDIKNILNGLVTAAGDFALAQTHDKAMAQETSQVIVDGINYIRQAQKDYPHLKAISGKSKVLAQVNQALAQQNIFGEKTSKDAKRVAHTLAWNVRSGKKIGEFISYIGAAMRESLADLNQSVIFGDKKDLSPGLFVNKALHNMENSDDGGQKTLFGSNNESGAEKPLPGDNSEQSSQENKPDTGEGGPSDSDPTEGQNRQDPKTPIEDSEELIDISPEDLDYQQAYDAHQGTSHVPDDRAKQEQQGYYQHMKSIQDKFLKLIKPEQREDLKAELRIYQEGYLRKYGAVLSARSKTMSSMITGPSNFPTARNQKRLDAEQKRYQELEAWDKKAQNAIKRELGLSGVISSDDPQAIKKLKDKLANLEKSQQMMKDANRITRNKKLSDKEKVKALIKLGLSDKMAIEAMVPDYAGKIGFASYALTNNNANIKRVKDRIADLEKKAEDETITVKIGDVEIIDNVEDNRVQIIFDGKPDVDTRKDLKANGFRWAPSVGAWQRHRSNRALSLAHAVVGGIKKTDEGTSPFSTAQDLAANQEKEKTPESIANPAERYYAGGREGDVGYDTNLVQAYPVNRVRQTGEIAVSRRAVKSVANAAEVLSGLGEASQEELYLLATDKSGKVLNLHKFSKGTSVETPVHINQMAGHLLAMPGVSKVYFAHNHPSGDLKVSEADQAVFKVLRDSLSIQKIETEGFLIGWDRYLTFDENGEGAPKRILKSKNKKYSIPVTERKIVDRKQSRGKIFSPYALMDRLAHEEDGILFAGINLLESTFIPFKKGMSIRDAAADILSKASEVNAEYAFINVQEKSETNRWKLYNALAKGLDGQGIRTLDMVSRDANENLISFSEVGELYETNPDSIRALASDEILYHAIPPSTERSTMTDKKDSFVSNLDKAGPFISEVSRDGLMVDIKTFTDAFEALSVLDHINDLLKIPISPSMGRHPSQPINGKASPSESLRNSMRFNLAFFSNLINSDTFSDKGFSGIDIKTQRTVNFRMGVTFKNLEVIDSIVKFIPVNVMDNLMGEKFSADMFFDNPSMLRRPIASMLANEISRRGNSANTLIKATTLGIAEKYSSLIGVDFTKMFGDFVATVSTNESDFFSPGKSKAFSGTKKLSRGVVVNGERVSHDSLPTLETSSIYHSDKHTIKHDGAQAKKVNNFSKYIDLSSVKKRFKGQNIEVLGDGSLSIQFNNDSELIIKSVEEISDSDYKFAISSGKMQPSGILLGKYLHGAITLSSQATTRTLDHELVHHLENVGIIGKPEKLAIDAKINEFSRKNKLDFSLVQDQRENRANFISQYLEAREQYRGTPIGKALQKISDLIDALIHVGRKSVKKLAKGMETGKIYNQTPKKGGQMAPQYHTESDRIYTPEVKDFLKAGGFGQKKNETFKEKFDQVKVLAGDKLRQGMVDQFHSLNKVLKDKDAWMMAHLTKSDTGVLMTAINEGMPILDDSGAVDIKEGSKSLKDILAPLGNETDDFLAWIAAHRSENLLAEDKENLFTPEQIAAGKTLNKGREALYGNVRKDFEDLGAAITDIAVKTGLVNEEEAQQWRDEGFYVPFYRMLEDQEGSRRGPGNINGLTNQKAYKKLKGGISQLDDLLTNTLLNWNHLISAGLRNQAGKKALESAADMGLASVVPKAIKSKDAVYVRDNGQEVWYELDQTPEAQLVLDSIMSLNYEGLNSVAMKGMRMFKRVLTRGVTASPGFKIRNLIRDSMHAPAVATVSKNPLKNIAVGFKEKATMKRMESGGGAFSQEGYIHGSDPDAIKGLVGVASDSILNTPHKIAAMWRKYEDFGNTLENINRVASFKNDLSKGKSLLEANFNARDQLDFSRSGSFSSVRVLTQVIPFLNARMQGLDKIGRAVMDPAQRNQLAQVVGMYTIASVSVMLAMAGDDDYDEAPEWEKRTYHLFKIPGVDKMFRIPRPFEVGAIAYMNEQMARQFVDANAKAGDLGSALYHTLSDTFAVSVVPQAFKPLLEVYANKDSFRNTPIESMSMQRLSKKERSKPWTSDLAKGTSSAMSAVLPEGATLSPVQIQHLVRAYTGWAGATTLASIDFLIKKINGDITPKTKISEYTWNPVSSFARDNEAKSSKYVTQFYDNMSKLNTMWADIRKYRGTPGGKEVTTEQISKLRYRKMYNNLSKQLSTLRKQEEFIYKNTSMKAEWKRARLEIIRRRKNDLTKRAIMASKDVF